jgi:hypothetical protein
MQDRGAEKEARSPFPVSTISFRLLLEPEHTQRPVIAASPPTQQGRNPTAPARNQGRTRLKGNQWFLEPFSASFLVPILAGLLFQQIEVVQEQEFNYLIVAIIV